MHGQRPPGIRIRTSAHSPELPNNGDLEDDSKELIQNAVCFKPEQKHKTKQDCKEIPTSEGQWRIFLKIK